MLHLHMTHVARPCDPFCHEQGGHGGQEHAMKEFLQALDEDLLAAVNALIEMLFGLFA